MLKAIDRLDATNLTEIRYRRTSITSKFEAYDVNTHIGETQTDAELLSEAHSVIFRIRRSFFELKPHEYSPLH